MFVFIDESGVHKTTDHSTVAVVYLAVDNYDAFESAVRSVEERLKLSSFHWSETAWPVKRQFLDAVLNLKFEAKVAILKNPATLSKNLETVLLHMIVEPDIRAVYLDGKKSKRYERTLKKVLRDRGISVKKLRTVHDEQFAGIRVADMVAGLVRTVADGKNLQRLQPYYDRLKKKLIITLDI